MYFVTVCTQNRANLLADVETVGADPCVRPNTAGLMVERVLNKLCSKYQNIHGSAPTGNGAVAENTNNQ